MKDSYSFHTVRPAAAPEAQAHRKLPAGVIRFGRILCPFLFNPADVAAFGYHTEVEAAVGCRPQGIHRLSQHHGVPERVILNESACPTLPTTVPNREKRDESYTSIPLNARGTQLHSRNQGSFWLPALLANGLYRVSRLPATARAVTQSVHRAVPPLERSGAPSSTAFTKFFTQG